MTDELGSRQRDLSTSSVTKRANGHWHAIIASSCRWSQREYKRQPVHRINHPFASEPSGGIHYCSSCPRVRNWARCGRYSTAAVVAVSREKEKTVPVKTVTLGVCGGQPPACFSTKRADFSKRVHGWSRLLKMSYHPCVSGCGRSLAPQDGHDHCLTCLGIQHAEEAFVDGSCSSCGDMTISELRNRLRCVKHGGVPLPLPRSGVRPGTNRGGTASGGVRGDLRITVRASPSGGFSPLRHSAAGGGTVGSDWGLCWVGYPTRFLRCLPWWPDVGRCIGGRALSLRGWRLGCVAPFGCGSVVRARPRDDGYAFPGRGERRARVESSTASRPF